MRGWQCLHACWLILVDIVGILLTIIGNPWWSTITGRRLPIQCTPLACFATESRVYRSVQKLGLRNRECTEMRVNRECIEWIESVQKSESRVYRNLVLGLCLVDGIAISWLNFKFPHWRGDGRSCLYVSCTKYQNLCFFSRGPSSLTIKHPQLMLPSHPPVRYWSSHLQSPLHIWIPIFLVQSHSGTLSQNKLLVLLHLNFNCLIIAYNIIILGFT